ncbi:hypothetical protein ACJRO7_003820 [Eucalyptus globulus]|uniref:Hexosyltransferase n=1 Tax=Eucalyptus globulus TaxID=34317 RepID=A0ABD3IVA3_EUCGL
MPSDLALDCQIPVLDSIKASSPKEKGVELAKWVELIGRFDLERDEELIDFVLVGNDDMLVKNEPWHELESNHSLAMRLGEEG